MVENYFMTVWCPEYYDAICLWQPLGMYQLLMIFTIVIFSGNHNNNGIEWIYYIGMEWNTVNCLLGVFRYNKIGWLSSAMLALAFDEVYLQPLKLSP